MQEHNCCIAFSKFARNHMICPTSAKTRTRSMCGFVRIYLSIVSIKERKRASVRRGTFVADFGTSALNGGNALICARRTLYLVGASAAMWGTNEVKCMKSPFRGNYERGCLRQVVFDETTELTEFTKSWHGRLWFHRNYTIFPRVVQQSDQPYMLITFIGRTPPVSVRRKYSILHATSRCLITGEIPDQGETTNCTYWVPEQDVKSRSAECDFIFNAYCTSPKFLSCDEYSRETSNLELICAPDTLYLVGASTAMWGTNEVKCMKSPFRRNYERGCLRQVVFNETTERTEFTKSWHGRLWFHRNYTIFPQIVQQSLQPYIWITYYGRTPPVSVRRKYSILHATSQCLITGVIPKQGETTNCTYWVPEQYVKSRSAGCDFIFKAYCTSPQFLSFDECE
ncbi:uncharacterized protein LOC142564742 isoform X2 [Dermacentor variabilis]|uniref:uncharacterized protein LOC142564742 isoform X2 n=2 Tax=Dermacentor variabilis TaxID=34621 RepID=UPI003F5B58E7